MRAGLDGPTAELPPEDVADLRAFFDAQSRVKLAVWVRHEQQGADGPVYDHHLMLGVDDADYEAGDMWALELGIPLPALRFDGPTWAPDIFRLSEVDALRSFGTVVWEHDPETATGDDPLDYRLTWEPVEVGAEARERLGALLASEPGITCVEATRQRLWRGREEIQTSVQLFVDAAGVRLAVPIVQDAARAAGLATAGGLGVSLGRPWQGMTTAKVYEAPA